ALPIFIVVPSVPASVKVLFTVSVLLFAMVSVAAVAGAVSATLLIEVAEATPRVGVVKVGPAAIATTVPVPVIVYSPSVPALLNSIAVLVPLVIVVVPTVRPPPPLCATQAGKPPD